MTPDLKSETSNLARRARRGLSLLEVLFAIFVAAVGLLGLAALLTVGGVQTAQSEQADRSAAFGRYNMREIETRNMLRPFVGPFRSYDPNNPPNPVPINTPNWVDANGNGWPTVNLAQVDATHYQRVPPAIPGTNPPVYPQSFVIDPLFVAENGANSPNPSSDRGFPFSASVDANLQLPRVTLNGLYNKADLAFSRTTADRVFTCRDDVEFVPPDKLSRPDLLVDTNKQVATIAGNYSYLVMVTPSEAENPVPTDSSQWTPNPATWMPTAANPYYRPLNKAVALDDRRVFTVQVVVFYKRVPSVNTSPPSERQVSAQISAQSVILQPSDASLVRGLAPNQWVMLSAYLKPPNDPTYSTESSLVRPIHRWVRIVSIGDAKTANPVRLNFAGPDWGAGGSLDLSRSAAVTIVDNVIGVYERTVELDARSLTGP